MYNEIVVVRVDYFKATGNVQTLDAKGKPNVILLPICGKMPNQAQVLSGSVAMGNGILESDGSIGSSLQMVHVTEGSLDPVYGRQFNVAKLGDVLPTELAGLQASFGKGAVEITKEIGSKTELIKPEAKLASSIPAVNITEETPVEETV